MKHAALAIFAALLSSAPAVLVASPSGIDERVERGSGLASKKADGGALDVTSEPPPLLATLVQTHTDERVPLDDAMPTQERFSALLADRVTGERHAFDPRLLDLLRSLARNHPGARIELVSGYRSAKLNETMRKKGHHVASHSQHSLGHACDFRIVLPGDSRGLDPRGLEKEIRDLGWTGGVGVYPLSSDWFVHADVGPTRRWTGN
ncbi:MAG: putative exported protein [Myxococcaceae bacterium]|nr:putative exported protein [Myxococcaceae bacterium]MEA2753282.1 hypothetical protein [Myxococcales bacterium]